MRQNTALIQISAKVAKPGGSLRSLTMKVQPGSGLKVGLLDFTDHVEKIIVVFFLATSRTLSETQT